MRNLLFASATLVVASCGSPSEVGKGAAAPSASGSPVAHSLEPAHATEQASDNPLVLKWKGSYGGVPPFASIRVEHFKAGFATAMDDYRRELATIANDPAAPTFANTLGALEDAGREFRRVDAIFGIWSATMNGTEFQAVEREMAPKLAAFSDEITQNEKLFKRIEAIYQSPEKSKLTPEEQRLAWRYYTRFVRAGAKLDAMAKKRLSEMNQRLATLYTTFNQNLLADEEGYVTLLEDKDLDGLPESFRKSAAAAADAQGAKGKFAVTNTRSSVDPFLTYSARRDLRQKVWQNFVNRGDNGDGHDNNKTIAEILKLRAERAKLLGYATHAHWRVEDTMAKTPERATALMESVWPAATQRAHEEVADMQAIANKDKGKPKIAAWDYRFYAEKVRKAKFALDQNEVKPYLQLEKLREGMFWVAGELFGFEFTQVRDIEVYHPDVRVWEVKDKASGKHIGLWYFDAYARSGKRSGAWMSTYRAQEKFKGEVSTILSNNANFVKGQPGEPVLISWDDAQTLFHEFGHALHGLSSSVNYPTLAGTSVARDYVEFPSQLLEHWLSTPEVLNRFALHSKTGAPIPRELVQKIEKAATFNQGFATVEYLSSALVDMKLHLAGDKDIDPDSFEKETLKSLGMPEEIVMRHRTPQFAHLFASDSYSAGYYSYLWSDTLSADAFEAFKEASGPYDKNVAASLRKNVFAVGNTIDPADGYRGFRGRDAGSDALMRKRGFAKKKPAPAGPKT